MRHIWLTLVPLIACGSAEPAEPNPTSEPSGGEAPAPTFADDVRMMCDAPNVLADRLAEATPEMKAVLLAEHIDGELATEEGRALFEALPMAAPEEKATMLREAEGAPDPCPMADLMEAGAEPGETDEAEGPSVEPGGATGGGRDRATLAQVIGSHINEVRYCYERELVRDPQLEGTLRVRFTIAADGSVAAVEVTTAMHPEVDRCVKERIRGWTFSESDGVTVVNYPFVFQHTEE